MKTDLLIVTHKEKDKTIRTTVHYCDTNSLSNHLELFDMKQFFGLLKMFNPVFHSHQAFY